MKEKLNEIIALIENQKWHEAHEKAQENEGVKEYDRLHALLHRIEGDEWNAKYWYRQCNIPYPEGTTIEEEIKQLRINLDL